MANTIKFIHSSDFHLDRSIKGMNQLPDHLIETLANAPYTAAQKVFDLAVSERVDFLLLAGDLYHSESGSARALAFLLNQFQRLADKGIAVYWCGGETDHPDRWPGAIELPENVTTFSSRLVEQVDHRRDGKTIARIIAGGYDPKRRSAEAFAATDATLFNIALGYGEFDTTSFEGKHIRYWALGGRHRSSKLEKLDTVIAYPGTPQGRTPKESGAHGFNICRVDTTGKLRVQTVESDRVRWQPQKVAIDEWVHMDELKNELGERALKIIADTTDQVVLCRWLLATQGEFNPRIHTQTWKEDLLKWLQDEFGRTDHGLWSVDLKVEAPDSFPLDWYEEDTILGEFMRVTGRYLSDDSLKLNLHDYIPSTVESKLTAGLGQIPPTRREEILRQATLVGIEYLALHKEGVEQ